MGKDILHVTQKIDIIEEDFNTQKKAVFFSRIEDVREGFALITPPFRKGYYLPPRIGRIMVARVVWAKVPYLFDTTLLSYISEQIPLWEISTPKNIHKIQLREDVRLDIGLPVKLEVLDSDDEKKIIKTLTRDFSAGGMQVVLSKALEEGTKIGISIALGDKFIFETKGQVVRLIPPMPPLDKYFAGIKFDEVDEPTKRKILRYIFSKQSEMRMKEKEWFG